MGRLARSRLSTNNRNSSRQAPTGSERGESVIFDVGFLILPPVAAPTPVGVKAQIRLGGVGVKNKSVVILLKCFRVE